MPLDFTDLWKYWPSEHTEVGSFESAYREGTSPAPSVTALLLRSAPLESERTPSAGVYRGHDVSFCVPAEFLGGLIPAPGDHVLTGPQGVVPTVWTVLASEH